MESVGNKFICYYGGVKKNEATDDIFKENGQGRSLDHGRFGHVFRRGESGRKVIAGQVRPSHWNFRKKENKPLSANSRPYCTFTMATLVLLMTVCQGVLAQQSSTDSK